MGEAKQEETKVEAKQEEKKEEIKNEEKAEEKKEEAKPSPPSSIVLSVDLHCVGCAKKIEKLVLRCKGAEEVQTDMSKNQVTIKGFVDPQALCARIEKKTFRKATLIPQLPPAEVDIKPEAVPPQVTGMTTVEILVNMHCEACADQLKRKILKLRGVQTAETDLSKGKVTVTGTMKGEKLVEYIHRRTGKQASIVPEPPKEEEKKEGPEPEQKPAEDNKPPEEKKEKPKEAKAEEKKEEDKPILEQKEANSEDNKETTAPAADTKEEKVSIKDEKKEAEGDQANNAATVNVVNEEDMMKRMTYWNNGGMMSDYEVWKRPMVQWMPVYMIEQQPLPPPPQLFSDENPNACCIS